MTAEIRLFMCLQDNFGVLIHDPDTGATAAIDAPEAAAIENALRMTGWKLTDILVTHHHRDHTGGIVALKQRHGCRVVGPRKGEKDTPAVDETVAEGDVVKVGGLSAKIIETPGHTLDQIAYWFEGEKTVFVGDALFSIGCGRVVEGTPPMMWDSLLKLRALPDDTQIYCGHEYTKANIKFAKTIEPDNEALEQRADEADWALTHGTPTIPVLMGAEKAANPFLRADVPKVAAGIGMAGKPAAEVFAEIRARKNKF